MKIEKIHVRDNFFSRLIKNNTGVSSKNFFLVSVTIIGLILLIIPAIVLLIEVFYRHTI
jgi:TM2 domain-containing membrane protein YozV